MIIGSKWCCRLSFSLNINLEYREIFLIVKRRRVLFFVIVVVILILVVGVFMYFLTTKPKVSLIKILQASNKELVIKSPVLTPGQDIPVKYTCDGDDISPPLMWSNYPDNTKSFLLIMYDPDAPGGLFIHWVLYDIPSSINSISENIPKKEVIEGVGKQGINDFGYIGYGGPCPPPGSKHRYIFVILALDVKPNLPPGLSLNKVLEEVHGRVLAYGELMVYYGR
mgnify:CR=1 FL=1